MGENKRIETCVGNYIAGHYARAVEVGIGRNTDAAEILVGAGKLLRCTDIRDLPAGRNLPFFIDDVFSPAIPLYRGADVIYAIRPAVEMIPPLIDLAKKTGCDLLICHLGFELFGDGGEIIDCGVVLRRYVHASESIKG